MEIPAPLMRQLLPQLDTIWKQRRCDACGEELWTVLNYVWQLTEYRPSSLVPRGQAIPLIVAQCDHCGNLRMANAITLGVIDRQTGGLTDGQAPRAQPFALPGQSV
jgi:hypothetical protein